MALDWDPVLVPSSENWFPRGSSRSGGKTQDGSEQVVISPAARWKGGMTIPCKSDAQVFAIRRVIALGRGVAWSVGPYEYPRVPWSTDAYGRRIIPKLLRRPDLDGTAYADGGARAIADTLLPATLTVAAPMNATTLRITRPLGTVFRVPDVVATTLAPLVPGMMFSLGPRMHVVDTVAGDLVAFRPWLLADFPAGAPVNLVSPKGTMRLASDDTGALELQLSRTGTVNLEFDEAL